MISQRTERWLKPRSGVLSERWRNVESLGLGVETAFRVTE
jgi:hypothetical protein